MKSNQTSSISRRNFVKAAGSSVVATAAGLNLADIAMAKGGDKYNILMIVTDQERYMSPSDLPAGYRLPGHEKLASRGVVF